MKSVLLTLLLLQCISCFAWALGPHELVVIANSREPDSVAIAHHYMSVRGIPRQNFIAVDPGSPGKNGYVEISPADFTRLVWQPVNTALRERGLDRHVLAWVYSTHFPYRVSSSPCLSLQGLTYLRNQIPEPQAISQAKYKSELFTGPDSPRDHGFAPQTFESARELLRDAMPLPNITLGYIGGNGNTKDEIIAMIDRGEASDYTQPSGDVFFVSIDDVRSRPRNWQFASAVEGLRRFGVNGIVTNQLPQAHPFIMGIMAGTANPDPAKVGTFLPGAMAEHLTSLGAAFDIPGQTKITRWIRAGATGSAGTVCEPMNYWMKFPHARFFNHYRMGCTMIESFYQSIRSPLQIMLIGDPLAAPWAPKAEMKIVGVRQMETVTEPRDIDLHIRAQRGTHYSRYRYMIDGQIVGEGTDFLLNPDDLTAGVHEFRAVALTTGFVKHQVFDTVKFIVP